MHSADLICCQEEGFYVLVYENQLREEEERRRLIGRDILLLHATKEKLKHEAVNTKEGCGFWKKISFT